MNLYEQQVGRMKRMPQQLPTTEELAMECAEQLDRHIIREGRRYTQQEIFEIIQATIPLAELLAVAEAARILVRPHYLPTLCVCDMCVAIKALHSKLSTHKDSTHES